MFSSNLMLHRMLFVFLLLCMARASDGTCLSYGHSCWGGHGKRNGGSHLPEPSIKHTSAWYISKFFEPREENSKNIEEIFKSQNLEPQGRTNFRPKFRAYNDPDLEYNTLRHSKDNLEADTQRTKWDTEGEEPEEEIMVLTPEVQRVPISKLPLFQIVDQNSNKPRNEY